MTALVSILMPVYNQASLVDEAVRSAVTQDYDNLEVVIADDMSDDDTADVIADLAREFPRRIRVLEDRSHLGVTGNCNRILHECRGEYIAFSAGDDVYLPGKISTQVAWFEAHPDRVLCGHDVEVFESESGRALYRWSERHPLFEGTGAGQFVRNGNPFHPLGNMVRQRAIPTRGYDARIPLVSDWKFFVDCLADGGGFGFVDGVFARYRQWSNNVSKRHEQVIADQLLTVDLIGSEHPHLLPECRYRRWALRHFLGRTALHEGNLATARREFLSAVRCRPTSISSINALLVAMLPRPVSGSVLNVYRRFREQRNGSYGD